MMRKSCSLLVGLALVALPALAGARAQSSKTFARYGKPLETVHLDLATGTVSRGAVAHPRAAATVSDFPNLDLSGFTGVDTGNCFCEWFDAGIKGKNGNASDLMNSFVLAYCSAKLDPSAGGPGGSTKLGFYEGYVHGGGTPTTAVAVFTLSGLPANTASSSFFGGFRCFFMTVEFSPLVCFADGPIGYSWKFLDLGLDGTLAGTWPFLSCVQSCSGHGPDQLGQSGGICGYWNTDEYCPPGTLRGCFTFGTWYLPTMSMTMDIREIADATASAYPFNGDRINADTLDASTAVLGGTWSAHLTIGHPHGAVGLATVKVRTTPINGPSFVSPIGGRLTEVLISGPVLASALATHNGFMSGTISGAVPRKAALLCASWAAQATVMGGGFADLSSSVFGVVGTR